MELKNGEIVGETMEERRYLAQMMTDGIAPTSLRNVDLVLLGDLARGELSGSEAILRGLIRAASVEGDARTGAVATLRKLAQLGLEQSRDTSDDEGPFFATLDDLKDFATGHPEFGPNSVVPGRLVTRVLNTLKTHGPFKIGEVEIELYKPGYGLDTRILELEWDNIYIPYVGKKARLLVQEFNRANNVFSKE